MLSLLLVMKLVPCSHFFLSSLLHWCVHTPLIMCGRYLYLLMFVTGIYIVYGPAICFWGKIGYGAIIIIFLCEIIFFELNFLWHTKKFWIVTKPNGKVSVHKQDKSHNDCMLCIDLSSCLNIELFVLVRILYNIY